MRRLILLTGCMAMLMQALHAQDDSVIRRFIGRRFDGPAPPNTGPAPDYSNLYYWAASPYKHDPADSLPAFLNGERQDSLADVFYIHPTTFIGPGDHTSFLDPSSMDWGRIVAGMVAAPWNADLDDSVLNGRTDRQPVLYQASVFNGSCRVFAPRYRQADLKAFVSSNQAAVQQAFDLAYGDLRNAFLYYLDHDNDGRPIIIAGHSQGSLHAIRLLKEFFDGKPLARQLVAAYIIGYQVDTNAFRTIPVCTSPAATGCVVSWRSYAKGVAPPSARAAKGRYICVNPLTWTTDTSWAPPEKDLGTMLTFNQSRPGLVSAGIEPVSKLLWVSYVGDVPERFKRMANLHIFDYNLFWMNIRENVAARVAAFERP
jgi:hypothetical protein